jgi:tetratricopeptide (TPR) repeat protein
MTPASGPRRPIARTLLEAEIRERNMTLEEFAEYAETISRQDSNIGTLSLRHLQRLVAGADPDRLRPATKRLLERIFTIPAEDLLAPATAMKDARAVDQYEQGSVELNSLISTAQRIDRSVVQLLADQIETIRKIDRRFGAAGLLGALRQHADHIEQLLEYSVGGPHDRALAAVLADAHTLAGWQSLDRGEVHLAWQHYRGAIDAARAAECSALLAHAFAEQAVVLTGIGRTADAAQLSKRARALGADSPTLLRSWLAAAHGEALAADRQQDASLHAFDNALALLPDTPTRLADGPYLALDAAHLTRWRGHALASSGHPDAITVLTDALDKHDTEFARAEAGLRTDLVLAYIAGGERDAARQHLAAARQMANAVGSARQRDRLCGAAAAIAS